MPDLVNREKNVPEKYPGILQRISDAVSHQLWPEPLCTVRGRLPDSCSLGSVLQNTLLFFRPLFCFLCLFQWVDNWFLSTCKHVILPLLILFLFSILWTIYLLIWVWQTGFCRFNCSFILMMYFPCFFLKILLKCYYHLHIFIPKLDFISTTMMEFRKSSP